MRFIADLHVHSPYAYACSKHLSLALLWQWAQVKGVDVLGTGDFTHPAWFATLQEELAPAGNGFYRLRRPPSGSAIEGISPAHRPVHFCLSSEVSTIYKDMGRVRKSHHLLFAPDLEAAARLTKKLSRAGKLSSDGRPTLLLSARNLLEMVLSVSPDCHLIPAHVWTPWFSILGSKTGYDSVEDAFKDLTPYIFALETGLSADPAMGWRVSSLDPYAMVSHSDAHSAPNLAREVTCFDTELSYHALFGALRSRQGFLGTLEFFPEAGKYYLDGHRDCGPALLPAEAKAHHLRCPACGRPLTLGVLHRLEELADRATPQKPGQMPDFAYIMPLPEIIGQVIGHQPGSKKGTRIYIDIINRFGDELTFLRHTPLEEISAHLPAPYAVAIEHLRSQPVRRQPGYDGRYGEITLWEKAENSTGGQVCGRTHALL